MSLISQAIKQIDMARNYTLRILDEIKPEDWFRSPPGEMVTHVAWQVGHIAMAEYRIALERIRGSRPEDESLISADFLRLFGKGSIPQTDQNLYPPIEEIRHVFDRVHAQVMQELPACTDAQLIGPPEKEHSLFTRKIDGLFYGAMHEMIHAGQIALIRRQLGYSFTF